MAVHTMNRERSDSLGEAISAHEETHGFFRATPKLANLPT